MTALVKLPEFKVIKLTGEQSHSFLQGQVTCDVNALKDNQYLAGAHCNAKGKAWSAFLAFERANDIYLVMVADSAEQSLAELNKYSVFSKTDITDDTSNWSIYGYNAACDVTENSVCMELAPEHFLIISEKSLDNANSEDADLHKAWWQAEIKSGRAHLFSALVGEYVPQMMNLQALDYISFNKGCYMGQEMVARMRYLGKNKRALFVAELSKEVEIEPGHDVYIEMNGNYRKSGKVLLSKAHNGTTVFQAVLPNDTELTQTIYIEPQSEQQARLLPLPYSLEQD